MSSSISLEINIEIMKELYSYLSKDEDNLSLKMESLYDELEKTLFKSLTINEIGELKNC